MDLAGETRETIERLRRRAGQGFVRQQLPAGPAAGRARRALRAALSHRLGPSRQPRHEPRRAARRTLPRGRPAGRDADQGPEAARAARRNAGDLGRRVRPHADGRAARTGRPRPSHRRLYHVDGRRRNQGRAKRSAAPTNWASTPSKTAFTSTTCKPRSCTCWAWTTAADVPVPGPQLPPHRRGRRSREEAAGVRSRSSSRYSVVSIQFLDSGVTPSN